MAQVVIEKMDSRSISDQAGPKQGIRRFWVYDDTGSITLPSQITFGDGTLPAFGEVFPGEEDIFATYFSIDPVPDSAYTWEVVWTYTPGLNQELPDTDPTTPGYVEFSVEYGGVFKDAYRAGANAWSTTYAGTDIGGARVDQAGSPVSVFVPQQRLVVTETITTASLPIRQPSIAIMVGKRNSTEFYGAAAGTLLYEGASGSRVSALTMQLVHRFFYDRYLHAEQSPAMNPDRQVDIELNNSVFRAKTVRWVQPFPDIADFNSLSENF